MNRILTALILFGLTAAASAGTRIEAWLSITNLPNSPTQSLTWNATQTRTWTNAVANAGAQIMTTNNIQNSRTNLKVQLDAYRFTNGQVIAYGTNTNDVVILARTNEPITIAIAGLWASVRYVTNTVYASDFLMAPPNTSQSNSFLVWQWSSVVTNLAKGTQAVDFTYPAFTNFPHQYRASQPPISNAWFEHPKMTNVSLIATQGALRNVSSSNMVTTNLTGYTLNLQNTNATNFGGYQTNLSSVHSTNVAAGRLSSTSGALDSTSVSNAPWVTATSVNLQGGSISNVALTNVTGEIRNFFGSNGIVHTLVVTNLSAPGTGTPSLKLGAAAIASGDYSLAIGDAALATNTAATAIGQNTVAGGQFSVAVGRGSLAHSNYSIAIGDGALADEQAAAAFGAGAEATHLSSTVIGASASSTAANQIRLGTSSEHVSIPGEIRGVVITNAVLRGTNVVNSRLDYTPRANSALANGYNSGVVLGSNSWIQLSGPSAAYTNVGFASEVSGSWHLVSLDNPVSSIAVLDNSGLDATAANRIRTGTGGILVMTNNPAWMEVIYDTSVSRWRVIRNSN